MRNTYSYNGIGVVVEGKGSKVTRITIDETVRTRKTLPFLKPDMSKFSEFEEDVAKAVMAIPAGKTSSKGRGERHGEKPRPDNSSVS
jgi:hypothetical protein